MPLYESVFIARQDISAAQVETLTEELQKLLGDNGGSLHRQEYWGLRNLTYRIKKNKKGHYMQLHIDAPAPAVAEMERVMRLNEDVLRYLTIRVEEFDENPSPVLQAKGDKDRGRGRRDRDDHRGGRDDRPRDDRPRDDRPREDRAPKASEGGDEKPKEAAEKPKDEAEKPKDANEAPAAEAPTAEAPAAEAKGEGDAS